MLMEKNLKSTLQFIANEIECKGEFYGRIDVSRKNKWQERKQSPEESPVKLYWFDWLSSGRNQEEWV
ncbi:hypothetical protein [Coxiella-like endosymbiont]|uniref:hypothetical protein n=1 Tax=Coxiella-like endosymbiont TaxID=1592897 RepID=UPI00272C295C|nr:hypothetical protein [Coxiella-like endosymbiont]